MIKVVTDSGEAKTRFGWKSLEMFTREFLLKRVLHCKLDITRKKVVML